MGARRADTDYAAFNGRAGVADVDIVVTGGQVQASQRTKGNVARAVGVVRQGLHAVGCVVVASHIGGKGPITAGCVP